MLINYFKFSVICSACVFCICALFIVVQYLCLYDVPFLSLTIWLFTHHINKNEIIIIIIIIIIYITSLKQIPHLSGSLLYQIIFVFSGFRAFVIILCIDFLTLLFLCICCLFNFCPFYCLMLICVCMLCCFCNWPFGC